MHEEFNKIEEINGIKYFFNKNYNLHRLNGPAIIWVNYYNHYCINGCTYAMYSIRLNTLYCYKAILNLSEYEPYIKQNIKDLIKEYNPGIHLSFSFINYEIDQLPDWLKDLIIL